MKSSLPVVLICLNAILSGCSPMEGPELVSLTPAETVSQIRINSDFVMMQVGDTLSLGVNVIAQDRSPISYEPDKVLWLSQDTSQLEVNESGEIKAKVANSLPIRVIVSYKQNLNTVRDTVQVYITPNRLDGSAIKLRSLDSNTVGALASALLLSYPRIRVDILDASGDLISAGASIPISTPSPVTNQFSINGGNQGESVYLIMNESGFTGRFWIKSSVNLYGKPVSDSVEFIGLYPVASGAFFFNFVSVDENGTVIAKILDTTARAPQLQPCGAFMITNGTPSPIDIVFSDSTSTGQCQDVSPNVFGQKVVGGNILNLSTGARGIRRIRTTGVVDYYVRDAITKERLPVTGRYESVEPGE